MGDKKQKAKVISMGKFTEDSGFVGVGECLDTARSRFEDKNTTFKPKNCVIIFLDRENGQYNIEFNQAGMRVSEMVALLEVTKHFLSNELLGG